MYLLCRDSFFLCNNFTFHANFCNSILLFLNPWLDRLWPRWLGLLLYGSSRLTARELLFERLVSLGMLYQRFVTNYRNKCKYYQTLSQKKVKQWRSTKNNCPPLHITWPKPIPRPQRCVWEKHFPLISFHSASGKSPSSKNLLNWRLECKTNTLFLTKMAEKPYPLGLYIPACILPIWGSIPHVFKSRSWCSG